MAIKESFVPYSVSKTPEERRAFVDAQITKGNPKYMSRDKWLKANETNIRISSLVGIIHTLQADIKGLKDIVLKFTKSK